jgi:hypothetical protein
MCDFTSDETRIYVPAESVDMASEGYPQLITADTGWTEEERKAMRERGYDGIDMLRAWLD